MLDKILDFIAEQIEVIKSKLGVDSYTTTNLSWGYANTWTCPQTGIVTLYIEPSTQSTHYAYIKDDTTGIEVYGHYQSGTVARYSGQFIAIKGHTYSISVTNLKTSTYKYTKPTGWGGSVNRRISTFLDTSLKGGVNNVR